MPELPEVETITRQLNSILPGKTITSIEVLLPRIFTGNSQSLIGLTVTSVIRRQKTINISLASSLRNSETSQLLLVIHLKMTGQLIYTRHPGKGIPSEVEGKSYPGSITINPIAGGHPTADWKNQLPGKHTRVIFHFADGSNLYFNDQRTFGWVKIVSTPGVEERIGFNPGMNRMIPDVVDPEFTLEYFKSKLTKTRRPIKLAILDQQLVGGMGNIYACDALNISKINPNTPANQLKIDAVKILHQAMIQVINEGIKYGGTTISHFMDTSGTGGSYQNYRRVYDREGEPCLNCQTSIIKIRLGGRGTYYCPNCQI